MLHRFVIDTDSGLSANNGLASAITPNAVFVQWTEAGRSPLVSGYNLLRATDGVSFEQINSGLLTQPGYLDTGAPFAAGTAGTVNYRVMQVDTGANSTQLGLNGEKGDISASSLPRTGSADLRVAMTGPAGAVRPGQEMEFTVSAANDGPEAATVPDIVEMFPPEVVTVTGVTVPPECTETHAEGKVVIQLPSAMAVGTTFTATVRAVCGAPFTLRHYAVVSSPLSDDPNPVNNVAGCTVVVRESETEADVSVAMAPPVGALYVGQPATFRLTVANAGPMPATGVVVSNPAPAGASFVSASTTTGTWSQAGGTVTWTVGTLASGESATLDVAVRPDAAGSLTNKATAWSLMRDPDMANNAADASATVAWVSDVSVTKTAARQTVIAGETLAYTLVVSNAGPSGATGITLTDLLPATAEFVSASPAATGGAGQTKTWNLGALANGAATTVTVVVRPMAAGTATNTASVSAAHDDPDSANNTAEASVSVQPSADVRVTITAARSSVLVDEDLTFTLVVSNAGQLAATDVVLTDTLPAATVFVSASPVPTGDLGQTKVWNLGELANGEATTVTVVVRRPTAGPVTNTASVSSAVDDPDSSNNTASASATVVRAADLRVEHSSTPNPAVAGLPVAFSVGVSDSLGAGATGVEAFLDYPPGLAMTAAAASDGTVTSDGLGRVTVSAGALAPGGRLTLVTTGTASAAGLYPTVASVLSAEPELTPADTSATLWTVVEPAFRVARDDGFSTGAVTDGTFPGWIRFGMNNAALGWQEYDQAGGAYRAQVKADPAGTHFRDTGAVAAQADWLPYALVGNDRYVRAKFMMYAGGQANPADQNQVPNFRLRLSNRFAVNSMLEVFNHEPGDSAVVQAMYAELRPSTSPTSPSVYRVDMDPVDVPYLVSNAGFEGVQRGFEAYAIHPTDQGYVAMTESVIGTYPLALTPPTAPAAKVYVPDAAGAGDLAVYAVPAAAELTLTKLIPSPEEGGFAATDDTTAGLPAHAAGPWGATLDTMAVATDRIGVATRNFNPDRGTNDFAHHVRVAEGKQYAVRFHLTSTQQVNRQAQIRLRGRSVKFGWSKKFELGGAWGTGGGGTYPLNQNNSIAQQALPGVGCENPDRSPTGEPGGWYTMIVHTPLSADIRPEFAAGIPLATRMPGITAQPGPGVNATSRRDLLFGMDLVDTLSAGAGRFLEQGNVTLDRIEVRVFDLVPD